jgi:hypothetical protein
MTTGCTTTLKSELISKKSNRIGFGPTPQHVNSLADYRPQKVLAVSPANAVMQNYISICEHQTKPNPVLAAVHSQATLLLRHNMSNCYVSPKLLAAAPRTPLRLPSSPSLLATKATNGPAHLLADSSSIVPLGAPRVLVV